MEPRPEGQHGDRRSAAAWRARALVEIQNLWMQLLWMEKVTAREDPEDPIVEDLAYSARSQLANAEKVINSRGPRLSLITGADIQTAREYIDAAAINLLRLAPTDHLASMLPSLFMEARSHLDANDPRLRMLAKIQEREAGDLSQAERLSIVAVAQATQVAAHQEQTRVRGFRNVILGVTTVVFAVATLVALLGYQNAVAFPLCFAPEEAGYAAVVCPLQQSPAFSVVSPIETAGTLQDIDNAIQEAVTPYDIVVVQFFGLLGATIAAASSLKNIRGSADPFSLGVALALLKLPTGALTAFLGLTLLRSGVVPGLSALDTSAQIVAWSIALGYSQQLFTRLVDQQGQQVLQQAETMPARSGRNN